MKMTCCYEKGLTLVELVMVMVLLGIVSMVAIPKFFERSVFDERAFFDDTLNAVRYAQKLAIVSGCKVQVTINANAYTIRRPPNRSQCNAVNPSYSLAVINPGTNEASYTGSQANVTLSSSPSTFTFDAMGNASSDVTLTIASKLIKVVSDTGMVYAP